MKNYTSDISLSTSNSPEFSMCFDTIESYPGGNCASRSRSNWKVFSQILLEILMPKIMFAIQCTIVDQISNVAEGLSRL